MLRQRCLIITLFIGEDFNAQAAVFIRKQRQFKIVNRPGRQRMGLRLDAGKIQLVVKNFHIQYRTKQRLFTGRSAAVAHNLLRIITLMTTHLLELPGQSFRQFR
ncbi:hypothetical protein D3C81_1856680 [compost metagenome]